RQPGVAGRAFETRQLPTSCAVLVREGWGEGSVFETFSLGHRAQLIRRFFPPWSFLLMALTPKKRRFIDAIRGGASNRDAAIAAGCPEKSASAAGSRLAKDPDVVNEL